MLRRTLVAAMAALVIGIPAGAQVGIASPFNPSGLNVPMPNPFPLRPTVIGNIGFTEPIVPLPGFFDTGPFFFNQGTFVTPDGETLVPPTVPLTGSSFVPLAPQNGGMPIGAAGAGAFGPVMQNATGFVPVTDQALPVQTPTGFMHRTPIQTPTASGFVTTGPAAGGFVAVTPDVLAVQPVNAIPRTSDLIDARLMSDGRLRVHWNGWNQLVDYATVSLLDKNRTVIKTATITRPPLEATFSLTNKTAYYQVVIHYLNGTVNSVVSPV